MEEEVYNEDKSQKKFIVEVFEKYLDNLFPMCHECG